jgi:mannose-6-phosphate isomerase-like protein (cupin superfamily)
MADGERLTFGDVKILIRMSTPDICVLEEVPPMVDTPPHVHEREDELFVSLEGDHVIELDGEEHRIAPGESVFAPRGIPHSQRRVVPGEGRLLIVTTPGGFAGFFRELAAADAAGTLGPEAYATASERYGISWL